MLDKSGNEFALLGDPECFEVDIPLGRFLLQLWDRKAGELRFGMISLVIIFLFACVDSSPLSVLFGKASSLIFGRKFRLSFEIGILASNLLSKLLCLLTRIVTDLRTIRQKKDYRLFSIWHYILTLN